MTVLLREEFGFHEWVDELQRFNVRYVEQLAALMATYQGRLALRELERPAPTEPQIGRQVDRVLQREHGLTISSPRVRSQRTGLQLLPEPLHGLGYHLPPQLQQVTFGATLPQPVGAAAAAPTPPPGGSPASHDLRSIMTPVRDQYFRGTCVAFATTALLESKLLRDNEQTLDLSEQYVYFLARINDPDRREDGTYPRYALDGLRTNGACREELWPYREFNEWGQGILFADPDHPLADLHTDATAYQISVAAQLNPNLVLDIQQALLQRQPVCIAVPVFENAWHNGFTQSTGEVQMPLTRLNSDGSETVLDDVAGGHAIAVVGFQDTPNPANSATYRPGGGYFVFKNSWGTSWAQANTQYGPGYGILPYDYLTKYNWEAWVIS